MDEIREKANEPAQVVAEVATTLFDATQEIHQLPAQDRFALETAALLHRESPNAVRLHPDSGQSDEARMLVAATLARYRGDELPAAPDEQDHRVAALGALLRIAVALQNLPLDLIIAGPERLEIHAQGDETELEAVQTAAALWRELYGQVQVTPGPVRHDLSARLLGAPAVQAGTPFDQAVRAIVDFYLGEILEWRAQAPEEVIPLHRTVQGARRVFRMTGEQLDVTQVASIPKHLRWLSKSVRPVRQWHAMILNAESYLAETDGPLPGLEALVQDWRVQRAQATDEASSALNSDRYREFAAATRQLMRSRNAGIFGKGTPRQPLYCVLPSMLWEQYQRLRASGLTPEPPTNQDLRSIRGEARDLYYLLAQYQSVLGPSGATCMRAVLGLEESLTFYLDMHRTIRAAKDCLEDADAGPMADVHGLIEALQADREAWLGHWPGLWKTVTSPRFRQSLGRAVAAL
jgi:hypothetical protein